MNPNAGEGSSRVQDLAPRVRVIPTPRVGELAIYQVPGHSLSAATETLLEANPEIPLFVASNAGIKQFFHASTGHPIPMPHLVIGKPRTDAHVPLQTWDGHNIDKAATYAFCLPADDARVKHLRGASIEPKTSATILAHRMSKDTDWSFISTAEI